MCAIALIGMSCDPPKWIDTHAAAWYARNNTDRTLIITTSPFIETDAVAGPGDSVPVHRFNPFSYQGTPSFDLFYDAWSGSPERERSISLFSEDGRLLKTWSYADRNAGGRQLFDESCWRLRVEKSERYQEQTCVWVFDIIPEDVAPL